MGRIHMLASMISRASPITSQYVRMNIIRMVINHSMDSLVQKVYVLIPAVNRDEIDI